MLCLCLLCVGAGSWVSRALFSWPSRGQKINKPTWVQSVRSLSNVKSIYFFRYDVRGCLCVQDIDALHKTLKRTSDRSEKGKHLRRFAAHVREPAPPQARCSAANRWWIYHSKNPTVFPAAVNRHDHPTRAAAVPLGLRPTTLTLKVSLLCLDFQLFFLPPFPFAARRRWR